MYFFSRFLTGGYRLAGRRTALLTGLAACALLTTQAQQVARAQAAGEPSDELKEIVVTGSRIARPELAVPTPTTVIGAELIDARGITNIIDLVDEFPQIGDGFNNTNTSFSFGNVGLNQLNLRNLGVNRTLSLIDGRRRVGTPNDANFLALDVGNIPTALIDRVEIQTGGSAAVYGADAVAGVVNFILKKDFEGVQFQAQYGTDEPGDYNDTTFSMTLGGNFDRGNAVFNVTHLENTRLLLADRGLDVGDYLVSNPANTGPNDGIPARVRLKDALTVFFGIPTITTFSSALGGYAIFDPTLDNFRAFNASNSPRGVIDGFASLGPDGGHPQAFDSRIVPLRRTSAYAKLDYDLTDSVRFVNELMFTDSTSTDRIGPVFDVFSTFVATDNPFMPAAVRQQLIAGGEAGVSISRQHDEFGPRGADINRNFWSFTTGLEGEIASKYQWSVYGGYGKTNTRNSNLNDRLDANWSDAIDAIADPVTGQPVCRDAAARARGCVPVDVFGVGTISQAALDYVRVREHTSVTDTAQKLAQAIVTGPLFELPAGDLKFALGAEYREDELNFRPSFVWEQALGFFASQFSPVEASSSVREAYAELLVPILKDRPFAKSLDVEGAWRYSDYERAGGVDTYKLGLSWAPVADIRFRATKSGTVRAPALAELFDPGSRGAQGLSDPCDPLLLDSGTAQRRANCLALGLDPVNFDPNTRRVTTLVFTTGNPDLDVEEANTLTAGLVFQPRWVPNLTIAADWYDIDLRGGIARIGAQQTIDNCVDLPSIDNQFCGFTTRDATGNIDEVKDSYVNASGFRVKGIDFEVSYAASLNALHTGDSDWGSVRARLVGTHQITNAFIDRNIATGVSTTFDRAGEYDNPEWRALLNLGYRRGSVAANWYVRWIDSTVTSNSVLDPAEDLGPLYHVPSVTYHDASFAWDSPWNVKLSLGVNNVFDEGPRNHPFTSSGRLALDDVLGRFFYVRVTAGFAGSN